MSVILNFGICGRLLVGCFFNLLIQSVRQNVKDVIYDFFRMEIYVSGNLMQNVF